MITCNLPFSYRSYLRLKETENSRRKLTIFNLLEDERNHNIRKCMNDVRFEVLKATILKLAVFWDVAPCGLVGTGRRFGGAYSLWWLKQRLSVSAKLHGETSQKTDIFMWRLRYFFFYKDSCSVIPRAWKAF